MVQGEPHTVPRTHGQREQFQNQSCMQRTLFVIINRVVHN